MNLTLWESNRCCAVEARRSLARAAIKKEVLQGRCVRDAFTVLATPAPARDQTWFKVCTVAKDLVIAIAVFDSAAPTTRSLERPGPLRNGVEVFFDTRHDHIGYYQYIFEPDGSTVAMDHQPYVENHATTHRPLRLKRHHWEADKTILSHRLHWLWLWFERDGVFAHAPTVGFNITRFSPAQEEHAAWNHCAGGGYQDAGCFGHLYLHEAPARLVDVAARWQDGRLHLSGRVAGMSKGLALELADPLDARQSMRVTRQGNGFTASVELDAAAPHGHYRIYPSLQANAAPTPGAVEPGHLAFDIAAPQRARAFRLAVTYDVFDNLERHAYTPERLEQEICNYRAWGIERIHWIEHGSFGSNPSFWYAGAAARNSRQTARTVPDLFKSACILAHKHGMEVVGVFKPFDLGFTHWPMGKGSGPAVPDLGEWACAVVPELAAHQEWTMQAHPGWATPPNLPVTVLRFYSREPFTRIAPGRLSVWASRDNRSFTRVRGGLKVRQEKVRRAHRRWTPGGTVPLDAPPATEWMLEVSGIELDQPYAAVKVQGQPPAIVHRMFALGEATGADGKAAPLTLATSGTMETGFSYAEGWTGWANYTEPVLRSMCWPGGALGLAFAQRANLPTLLEPGYEGARQIWLARLQRMLDSGADGVDVRTLCHHTGTIHPLPHAFAEPVRAAFHREFGRNVQPTPEDAQRIRAIRGRFYTQFVRDAKALTARAGKKLAAHLETGAEVPLELDQRMQMTIEWEKWIKEGIVDEVSLKGFAVHHPFVQERVMPLARRHGVEVQVVTRCLPGGLDVRAMEVCPRLATEACAAGLGGYSLYEAGELMRMNSQGLPMGIGHSEPAIRAARAALEAMAQ